MPTCKKLFTIISLFTITAYTQPCPQSVISQKALQSALYLEFLNGGGKPLTKELYSLSSQYDSYIAIFSYSGIQSIWKIKVNSRSCTLESVSKQQ